MEDVALERNRWWPTRVVLGELNLKSEYSICIWTFSFSQRAYTWESDCHCHLPFFRKSTPDQSKAASWTGATYTS